MFVHLSGRRDSWTAKLVLYNTKAKGCTTDKGPWYVSEECGREVVFLHQAQNKNAKYETVYRWLASFIVIYTIMNLKS
ncbi:MAG: hypothetical protein LM570_04700 [Thermocrinis sp.]|nr:hypothetical protein [Thermocrinis sp.]